MEVLNVFLSPIQELLEIVDNNKVLNSLLSLFLVLYAGLAAPKLPKNIAELFTKSWFKMIFLILIAYMSTKDVSLAVIAAVSLVLSIQTYNAHYETEQALISVQNDTIKNNVDTSIVTIEDKDIPLEEQVQEHIPEEIQ